jgi:hypothetical protein
MQKKKLEAALPGFERAMEIVPSRFHPRHVVSWPIGKHFAAGRRAAWTTSMRTVGWLVRVTVR